MTSIEFVYNIWYLKENFNYINEAFTKLGYVLYPHDENNGVSHIFVRSDKVINDIYALTEYINNVDIVETIVIENDFEDMMLIGDGEELEALD